MKSSQWFSVFVNLPVVIDSPGKYKTRGGEVVEVFHTSTRHGFNCVGTYPNGVTERWHKSGRLYFGIESQNDIVEKTND